MSYSGPPSIATRSPPITHSLISPKHNHWNGLCTLFGVSTYSTLIFPTPMFLESHHNKIQSRRLVNKRHATLNNSLHIKLADKPSYTRPRFQNSNLLHIFFSSSMCQSINLHKKKSLHLKKNPQLKAHYWKSSSKYFTTEMLKHTLLKAIHL